MLVYPLPLWQSREPSDRKSLIRSVGERRKRAPLAQMHRGGGELVATALPPQTALRNERVVSCVLSGILRYRRTRPGASGWGTNMFSCADVLYRPSLAAGSVGPGPFATGLPPAP